MNLAYYALKFLKPRAKSFEKSTLNPLACQKKVLFEYLKRQKDTEYGKKYNFSKIRSIRHFKSIVPLVDFESIRPYIKRMMKGEKNILTKDKVIFFGTTSGTTSLPKFIPVTKFSESKKNRLLELWVHYISESHPKVLDGKVLAVISQELDGFTESGLPYGAESGHEYKKIPGIVKNLYAIPYEVFEIKDYESKYYCILRIAMEENITTIATLNPTTLILLCQKIDKFKERIIKDIREGSLDPNLMIDEAIRKKIEKKLKPNPKRADFLKNILRKKLELLPKYFWPNLELIECWKGGTVKIYLKDFPKFFGNISIRDLGCLSTEASSSIPISDEEKGGILAIETNFYEFIPKEYINKKNKRTYLANELRAGKDYYIIITSASGLYRYNIDDIVRVEGFYNKTPMISFIQKGTNAISLTGEKLYESQVVEAVNKALDENKLSVRFFSAISELRKIPRYMFLVEFTGNVPLAKKKKFLLSIEKGLYKENVEYHDIRMQGLLESPVLKVISPGDFEKFRAKKIANGSHEGQFKVTHLTGDSSFINNFRIVEEVTVSDKECM